MTFMQGMPIGNYKFYSNYAVVSNGKTVEFINRDSIYVQPNYQNNDGWNSSALATQASADGTYNENNVMAVRYKNMDNQLVYYDPRSLMKKLKKEKWKM